MKRTLPLLLLAMAAGSVQAADVKLGQTIAMQGNDKGAAACLGCHGMDGAGNAIANFPRLSGLDADYIAKQIADYQSGARSNPVMGPMAMALSASDADNVAAYYAAQKSVVPPPAAPVDPKLLALGEKLAVSGNWDKEIPACFSCHGPGGTGIGVFPAIAGQHAGYIAAQINDWKSGVRKNDAVGLMKAVSDRLSPQEVAAVSAYLASLNQ